MSPVRTAIIGTGGIAISHIQAIQSLGDRIELVACVDIDRTKAESFAAIHNIPAVYDDPADLLATEQLDLVQICTPPGTHCGLIEAALDAGAWVYCEKPLCASLAEMDRIEAAEARTGRYCSSVFQWRFGSGGQYLKQLIQTNALGRPLVANVLTTWYRNAAYYAVPWRGKWETELGGVTMNHGIHAIDFFLWLYGEWREVRAMMGTLVHDIDVEDVSMAMVRFANGAMGNITNSVLSPREESYLRFDFADATVELTHLYRYTNAGWRYSAPRGGLTDERLAQLAQIPDDYLSSHDQQLALLLDSMDAGTRPDASGPDVRPTLEFLAALYKSAMTGAPVLRGEIGPDDPFYHRMCGPCDLAWQHPRK